MALFVEIYFITEFISSLFFYITDERFTWGWSIKKRNRINSAIIFFSVCHVCIFYYIMYVHLLICIRNKRVLPRLRIDLENKVVFFFTEQCNETFFFFTWSSRRTARDNNYNHNICNAITDGHTLACIAGWFALKSRDVVCGDEAKRQRAPMRRVSIVRTAADYLDTKKNSSQIRLHSQPFLMKNLGKRKATYARSQERRKAAHRHLNSDPSRESAPRDTLYDTLYCSF